MPDFGSRRYWDERFTNDDRCFDWLLPPPALRDLVSKWVEPERLRKGKILHIGCGTSDSLVLREIVAEPRQVHNVDFSQRAIDSASAREKEFVDRHALEPVATEDGNDKVHLPDKSSRMSWSCLDLIFLPSILELMGQQREADTLFDLVLDKSTSDSIACGVSPSVQLPYLLSVNGWTRGMSHFGAFQTSTDVHPLHILAVHLAALSRPNTGTWIAISYSEDRFPFLEPYPRSLSHGLLPDDVIKAGFPHPAQLWRLEAKEKIIKAGSLSDRKTRLSTGVVHRPDISHWLYVLVRTGVLVTD